MNEPIKRAGMAGTLANKPKRGIRGKDILKGTRKPKEFINKPMGVKGGKEEVNGPRKPEE